MKSLMKKIVYRISSGLVTTALAIILLSLVALCYDGTMICISTVFETLFVCVVIQLALWLLENWESANMIVDIIARYTVVIAIVVAGGYLFHWMDQLPVWLLAAMAFVVYFLGGIVEVRKVRSEIKMINDLTH